MYAYRDLITLFDACFSNAYNTRLIKGKNEPIYLPADHKRSYHAIYFAHGFFSSALHECAHWLIAGKERRKQVDFGYWYVPDGRTAEQQALFQQVEVKPQALEWILSRATGYSFRVSVDNLNGAAFDIELFKESIHLQVQAYCIKGIPKRAQPFRHALCQFYQQPESLNIEDFQISDL